MMFEWKQWRAGLATLVCACALSAQAADALPTSAAHPSGLPGSTVFSLFTVDLGTSYNLVAFDAHLDYDAGQLTFDADQSKLIYNGVTAGLFTALDGFVALTGGDFYYDPPAGDPGQYSLIGGTALGVLPLSGPVSFKAAFVVNPLATLGTSAVVTFSGNSSQEISPGVYSDDMFSAASTVSITAVPEPAHWAMLVLGLATISVVGRRRMGQQSR